MPDDLINSFMSGPDENGRFGIYGGRFVSETLMPLILELEKAYNEAKADPQFQGELKYLLWTQYAGRPSPLYLRQASDGEAGRRQDLSEARRAEPHRQHKINNVLGQVLLAKRMGKTRVIAETGAGQHGVATATACALFDIPCVVFMGSVDVERQAPNVCAHEDAGRRGAAGDRRRLDAEGRDERCAARLGRRLCENTFYCIGTVAGPHPYPAMVRDFQSIIGKEAKEQILAREGRLPDTLVAAIGGGSNAMGLFYPFLDVKSVRIIGVEAGGKGVDARMEHCASLTGGRPGVLHGNRTYLLQDDDGQILEGYSISAGLDYPGIGPEHSWLHDVGRAEYVSITDKEALAAFQACCELEGIIPALEPSHALAHVMKIAPELPADHLIVMNLCGRGDKDIFTVARHLGIDVKA